MGASVSKDDITSLKSDIAAKYAQKSEIPKDYAKPSDIPKNIAKPSDIPEFALKVDVPQDYATLADFEKLNTLALKTDIPTDYAPSSQKQLLAALPNYAKITDLPNTDLSTLMTQADLDETLKKRGLWCTADGKICYTDTSSNIKIDSAVQLGNYQFSTEGEKLKFHHVPSNTTIFNAKMYR